MLIAAIMLSTRANAQWKPLQGFFHGEVTTMLPGYPFFAVSGGDLFENTNGSWDRVLTAPHDIVEMALSTTNSGIDNILFAATFQEGVYASADFGKTWNKASNGLSNTYINCLAVAPGGDLSKPNTVFVGTSGSGIYRTTDDGANWIAVNTGIQNNEAMYIYSIAALNANNIYAATNDGMLLSSDYGLSWSENNTGIEYTILSSHNMYRVAVNNLLLFAATIDPDLPGKGIYFSKDFGKNWSKINNGLTDSTVQAFAFIDSYVFAATAHGVFKLGKGGTWSVAGSDLADRNIYCLGSDNGNLYAGTDAGFYVSSDTGQTWMESDAGMSIGSITVGTIFVNDSIVIAGTGDTWDDLVPTGDGAFYSSNGGVSWGRSTGFDTGATTVSCIAKIGSILVAGTYNGLGLYRSTDNGASWVASNQGLGTTDTIVDALGVLGTTLYASTNADGVKQDYFPVFSSVDTGRTWQKAPIYAPWTTYCFASDSMDWFAGSVGIDRSTDKGVSWYQSNTGFNQNGPPEVRAIVAGPNSLYAGTDFSGAWRSTDHGGSWIAMDSGLPIYYHDSTKQSSWYPNIFALVQTGDYLFAGTYAGVFLYGASSQKWKNVSDALDVSALHQEVESLAINGDNLLAGLFQGGIWTRSISEMIAEKEAVSSNPVISTTSISNYPNPASSFTTVIVHSVEQGHAEITLLNVLGSEVAHVFEGELESGDRAFTIDLNKLPDGVYKCRMEMNGLVYQTGTAVFH